MAKLNTSPVQMLKGHGPELNYSGAILRRTEPGPGCRAFINWIGNCPI